MNTSDTHTSLTAFENNSVAPARSGSNSAATGERKQLELSKYIKVEDGKLTADNEDNENIVDDFLKMTAHDILEKGKIFFRMKSWMKAAEYFSRAAERKVQELGGAEFHPALGTFYLWYGDSLLVKEEQNAELFRFSDQSATDNSIPNDAPVISLEAANESSFSFTDNSSDKDTASYKGYQNAIEKERLPSDVERNMSDEELAFDMLEMAKKCFIEKLGINIQDGCEPASLPLKHDVGVDEETRKEKENDVLDLSFALVRLGDMQLMNERYTEAAQDYSKAVWLREHFGLPKETIMAPLLSLAQATFFSGKKKESLDLFKRTHMLGYQIKCKKLSMPASMTEKVLTETLEDLQIQIQEIGNQIEEEANETSAFKTPTTGSQCDARNFIIKTTSTLDSPHLNQAPAVVVKVPASAEQGISVVERNGNEERTNVGACDTSFFAGQTVKKRRIDLKALKKYEATEG